MEQESTNGGHQTDDNLSIVERILAIHKVSQRLQKLLMPEELAQEIVNLLEESLNYQFLAILLLDEDERLRPFALSRQGKGMAFIESDAAFIESKAPAKGVGITGWVAEHGISVLSGDVQKDGRYFSMRNDIHSELCVPIIYEEAILGVVNIETPKRDAYSAFDQLVLEIIASQLGGAIQNAYLYRKLRDHATSLEAEIEERRLAEAHSNRLTAVVAQNSNAVLIVDHIGMVIYKNNAYQVEGAILLEPQIGENVIQMAKSHPSNQYLQIVKQAIQTQTEWQGILESSSKKGERFHETLHIFPIVSDEGNKTEFAIIRSDQSEEVILREQLFQLQKLESIGQMTSGIAHDFNNILTTIIGNVQIALRKVESNKGLENELTKIEKSSIRAADLVRQLMMFSRRQVIQPKSLELNELIQELSPLFERFLDEDIQLSIHLEDDGIWIEADPVQIEQILVNLLVNARDAINEKTALASEKEITILTQIRSGAELPHSLGLKNLDASYAVLSIQDNGIGIAADVVPHIFEPFFTTKEVGKGTGLGLATIYGIVKQNGGEIEVKTAEEVSTTFLIYWPLAKKSPDEVEEPLDEETADYTGAGTILLVEDDIAVQEFATQALTTLGFTVIRANNGVEALTLFEEHEADVVMTDMVMPKMGGRELASNLIPKIGKERILFVSGYADSRIDEERILAEDVHFISKPYSIQKLSAKLRQMFIEDS